MSEEYQQSEGYQKRNKNRLELKSKKTTQKNYVETVEKEILKTEKEVSKEVKESVKEIFANIDKEPKIIYSLLKDGLYPNTPNEKGDYPIHLLIQRDDALEVMKVLFDNDYKYKVNINAKNKDKQTALHLACKKGKSDLTNYLLEKGADPNAQDKDGNTSLHILSDLTNEGQNNEEILQQVLSWGGNIEIQNDSNKYCHQMTTNTRFERMYMESKFDNIEEVTGGDVEIGFSWKNLNDLDVHCDCNCGTHISYSNKKCHKCKGFLDYDMNVSLSNNPKVSSETPVEHIFWPFIVPGKYKVQVNYYTNHSNVERDSEYLVTISVKGQCLFEKKGTLRSVKETQSVVEFEFDNEKNFKILNDEIKTINVEKKQIFQQNSYLSNNRQQRNVSWNNEYDQE